MPPGIYSGRGKAQRTGDLPLGKGFDWTRTLAAQKEAAREEQLRAASSRPDSFQTLQQFEWLPQHGRTRPIRQYPPSSFSRTPASFPVPSAPPDVAAAAAAAALPLVFVGA